MSEPTPTDIDAVAQAVGISPTVQDAPAPTTAPLLPEQPAQQQPSQPTQQPAPTQQQGDPFQQLFVSDQPTEPTAQTPPQQTPQPTEPTPQPQQPVETPPAPTPTEPVATPTPEPEQSFDDYMKSVVGDIAPAPDMPDPTNVNAEDEESIGKFFEDLMTTAEQRFEANYERKMAIQNSERQLWDGAFDKYGSLKENKQLRDMVHAIRRAEFDKGVAITPTQAADRLLDALKQQYQRGVADNQVQTTIESVQPTGGGGQDVATTLTNQNVLESVQTGGEQALTDYLDSEIKAGRLK